MDKKATLNKSINDHIIQLEPHNSQQLELIILQILKYTNLPIEKDEIIEKIVEYGNGEIWKCITLIKSSYVTTNYPKRHIPHQSQEIPTIKNSLGKETSQQTKKTTKRPSPTKPTPYQQIKSQNYPYREIKSLSS